MYNSGPQGEFKTDILSDGKRKFRLGPQSKRNVRLPKRTGLRRRKEKIESTLMRKGKSSLEEVNEDRVDERSLWSTGEVWKPPHYKSSCLLLDTRSRPTPTYVS